MRQYFAFLLCIERIAVDCVSKYKHNTIYRSKETGRYTLRCPPRECVSLTNPCIKHLQENTIRSWVKWKDFSEVLDGRLLKVSAFIFHTNVIFTNKIFFGTVGGISVRVLVSGCKITVTIRGTFVKREAKFSEIIYPSDKSKGVKYSIFTDLVFK